jgi:hypothetical protein
MKTLSLAVITIALLLAGIGCASAYTTSDSLAAAGNVYVSGVTYDPGAFFTGDKGTVTVSVTNGNRNQSVVIGHATFGDENIKLVGSPYDIASNIGPSQTRDYTFSVGADVPDGHYYPRLSLSYRDAGSLYYPAAVWVDNTPLVLAVIDSPDSYSSGKKDTISVQIANPRKAGVKNAVLSISGDNAEILPASTYVGPLAAGASKLVNFTVTPHAETTLNVTLNYDNGDNHHSVSQQIPIRFSPDKKDASPVMSNIEVTNTAGAFEVTGDITNAGLSTANAVTITALSPAVPADPYRSYVIGALKPDDFGSFTVTFTAQNQTEIPLMVSYKDSQGNLFTSTENVTLPRFAAQGQASGSGSLLPQIIGAIALLVFIGGWAVYLMKRKE